jgi:predicted lipid-binding transport protein (Tim44 family)
MRNPLRILFSALVGSILVIGSMPDAEARRLGGGGSFGGKSQFSSPYKRAATPAARSPQQQQAVQHNQAAKQALTQRGGLMGMLGGLAIGGLLGALLFGGAFENLNFMDLLIFGGIAFMLYRLLAARRAANPQPAYARQAARTYDHEPRSATPTSSSGSFDTKAWFRGDQAKHAAGADEVSEPEHHVPTIPAGFDEQAFIAGARIAYRDLQKAWDLGDREAIKSLTTPAMFDQLVARIEELDANNRTDVLKLETELLDAREVDGMLEAVVLFDAIMREDTKEKARQVREVWHFTKPIDAKQPKWYLDGIQQLEDDAN